jgi:hypothetical protein
MKAAIPLLHERTERYAWQGSFDHFPYVPLLCAAFLLVEY